MMSVVFINGLDAKITNYEHELDGLQLVPPNARSDGGVIITSCIEALLRELVSQDSGLRYTINAMTNFEIYPIMVDKVEEIVFLNEFTFTTYVRSESEMSG